MDLGEQPSPPEAAITELLPLIGARVLSLNPRRTSEVGAGGGDFDLAVEQLDPLWPLRLPSGWRLCQVLHYDVKGWYWVLEHEGRTVALDTVDDAEGLGRDAVPTARLIELAHDHPEAARAAYLTAKRVRKSIADPSEWNRIRALADVDPDTYRDVLSWVFGRRLGDRLTRAVHDGPVPSAALVRIARGVQWLRRRRSAARLLASLWASAGRWYSRLAHPTGLFVLVAGPDGTGKSTLAEALPEICEGPFRRSIRLHWRPGILPPAGSLIGASRTDPTRPHSKPPHGTAGSLASLVYHWLDFFVGGWLRFVPFRARSGLIVLERGWWDVTVDPKRYRISAPRPLVRILGRMLPRPDLVIVLEAAPEVLTARKAEIDRDEILRQTRAWREGIPHRTNREFIDAAAPAEQVRAAAREAVFSALADRAASRLGSGWFGLPTQSSPRWILPRAPRRAALRALSIYQPITVRARLGWEAGRALASVGFLHLLPRGQRPPEPVRAAVASHMPPRSTLAVLRANHPGRFLALIVGADGGPYGVAKVASDESGIVALETEARNIERFGMLLEEPLRAPRILGRSPGLLLLEAVTWTPRARPWVFPPEVAHSLGRAHARSLDADESGMAHGDCAPWNLLRTREGWVLVDWEDARSDAPPFFDLSHFVVQAHALLGRPSLREISRHDRVASWVGTAVEAYAAGADRPASSWRGHLIEYLEASSEGLDPTDPKQPRALEARRRLLRTVRNSESPCSGPR